MFASTNYPNKLDEALRRPGRFDVHVPFTHATPEQASDLYKHFYPPSASPTISSPHATEIDEKSLIPTATITDQAEVDRRADQFAQIIEKAGIKVSIAVIQGFLLLYKKDPIMALERAEKWAEGIKKDQEEVGGKRLNGRGGPVKGDVDGASEKTVSA